MTGFRERYGPWAVVAGASAGLGECFARALAARGLDLILWARRGEVLESFARELRERHGVQVRTAALDLGRPDLLTVAQRECAGLEVGLLVYNAAHSVLGPFVERPLAQQLEVLDVNCRGPLVLAHLLGGAMAQRGRGGLLIMGSLAGGQGGPELASYAASKAFDAVLAEGLWDELGRKGVAVLCCRAGATRTRGFELSRPSGSVPLMEPDEVVQQALAALGRRPVVVAGRLNALAAFVFGRLLPRRWSIRIMGSATRRLYRGRA
jgi:hypothetical protein